MWRRRYYIVSGRVGAGGIVDPSRGKRFIKSERRPIPMFSEARNKNDGKTIVKRAMLYPSDLVGMFFSPSVFIVRRRPRRLRRFRS